MHMSFHSTMTPEPRPARSGLAHGWLRYLVCVAALVLLVGTWASAARPTDFKLKDLDGNWFRLDDHLGHDVIYITFWATWCAPCRRELPELQKMYDELGSQGLLVVAVNTDPSSSQSQVKSWVKQRKFSFPFILDPDNNVLDTYNPSRNLPFGILIDRQGNVVQTYAGYRAGEEALLKEKVAGLLAAPGAEAPGQPAEGNRSPATP